MLKTLSEAGIRHLGVDPAAGAADVAQSHGVNVRTDFFNESTAGEIRAEHGPAHLIYSANTISHISYLDSIFRGVDLLLAPDGLFVFEDRWLGDILKYVYFDQIYDEHIYLFSVRSVQAVAARFGFELIDAEHLPPHGGSIRYTVARAGTRQPTAAVAEFLARESADGVAEEATFVRFSAEVDRIRGGSCRSSPRLAFRRPTRRRVRGHVEERHGAALLPYRPGSASCGVRFDSREAGLSHIGLEYSSVPARSLFRPLPRLRIAVRLEPRRGDHGQGTAVSRARWTVDLVRAEGPYRLMS
jgi:Methyltransferase domain/C-methyltransferase C-terminal domain